MNKTFARAVFALLAVAYVLTHFLGHAHAQSSLGIGTSEAMLPQTGMLGGLMNWINAQQQGFYRALTGALKAMRAEGGQPWLLVGLSFAYGVFHAAGPGHGKAVISSYMLANEVTLRRGVMLSFISAFLQAGSAIILIGAIFLFLRGTSISMTNATHFLEVASYVLITLFGAWLLWKKLGLRLRALAGARPAHSLSAAAAAGGSAGHGHAHRDQGQAHARHEHHGHDHHHAPHGHGHNHEHGHAHGHAHAHHDHGAGEVCESCGHSHAPDPRLIAGENFDWRSAWTAVVAVGIRPCTGALIVLTFAFLNGLWAGGIVSVLAMALGTAITVSTLAIMAVTAKNWAVALAGDGRIGNHIHASVEIAGAALVFLLGLMLLTASLAA